MVLLARVLLLQKTDKERAVALLREGVHRLEALGPTGEAAAMEAARLLREHDLEPRAEGASVAP
jgi:hypothetical protein